MNLYKVIYWLFFIVLLNSFNTLGQVNSKDDFTIQLVGHAHIDLAYRWRWNETVDRVLPDTYLGVLKMMEKEKKLVFVQSQMAIYEELVKKYPLLFQDIKSQIKRGFWKVAGGQWSETDEIMPSGESFIRQFLIANEFRDKYLGGEVVSMAWAPDAFAGHAATLPKIYQGCGIKNYVFSRTPPDGKRIFWWQSSDSSKILAYAVPGHYNINITKDMLDPIRDWVNITKYKDVMVLFGEGDHGGGPRNTDFEAINKLSKLPDFPKMVQYSPDDYFLNLSKPQYNWPVHTTEFGVLSTVRGTWWNGCYTSQAKVKKLIRDAENKLLVAENMSTIGASMQGKPFSPRIDFRDAWKILLRNQSHDIFSGTCVSDANDDAVSDLKEVATEAHRLLTFGLETIGARVETSKFDVPLIVYNPLAWKRDEVVTANVKLVEGATDYKLSDAKQNSIPFAIDSISSDKKHLKISFLASGVPSIGYKVYNLSLHKTKSNFKKLPVSKTTADNEFFKIEWNNTGLTSIWDKKLGKELLSGIANALNLEEDLGSSWTLNLTGKKIKLISVKTPEVIENSPLRTVIEWTDRSESSTFIRRVILEKDSYQVKFNIRVNWQDSDKLLKLDFPVKVMQGKAFYEQPYGYVERPLGSTEYPAQNWIDLANQDWGIALLNNGRYGFNINEGLMRISVIRGARDMDPRMDEGWSDFDYALVPHRGDWRENNIVQKGLELNRPLLTKQENKHKGEFKGWTSNITLPNENSFYSTSSNHVLLSSLKVLQGDWSPENTILRLVETIGKNDDVIVHLPKVPYRIVETDHLEQPLTIQPQIKMNGSDFSFSIKHDEIRTFMVEYKPLPKE